jgi:hypothetical protein
MNKKYIVRLSRKERQELVEIVKNQKGSSQRIRRAQILLRADVNTSNWPDTRNAQAFGCRTQTIESLRKRLVTEGFRIAVDGKPRSNPPRVKILHGKPEAKVPSVPL